MFLASTSKGEITLLNFSGEAVAIATVGRFEVCSNAIFIEVTECGSKITPNLANRSVMLCSISLSR